MDLDQENLKVGLLFAVFLTIFFVVGFYLGGGTFVNKKTIDSSAKNQSEGSEVTQEEAIGKAKDYLKAGPFSYPFTYNLTTVSVNEHEVGDGTFYNWTISYTVEANPLQSPIYTVPGNRTKTTKKLTVYVSSDGKYLFQSPPIRTKIPERTTSGSVYQGP